MLLSHERSAQTKSASHKSFLCVVWGAVRESCLSRRKKGNGWRQQMGGEQSLAGLNGSLCDCVTASHPMCFKSPPTPYPAATRGQVLQPLLVFKEASIPSRQRVWIRPSVKKWLSNCSIFFPIHLVCEICTCHVQVKTQPLRKWMMTLKQRVFAFVRMMGLPDVYVCARKCHGKRNIVHVCPDCFT